jgi:two-component system, NtrC family, response regulator PilR
VFDLIIQAAQSRSSILIQGESGTGKELVARAIHQNSSRSEQPFVAVNSGSVSPELLESALFGHVRDAFAGAVYPKKGFFDLADRGTIFFDEIGNIPLDTQARLLRVIQDRQFTRLGGVESVNVDVRIIAATNLDLRQMLEEGRFREDLFYRLNVIQLRLPPLRDRADDIPVFLAHYLARFAHELGRPVSGFSPDAERLLRAYPYPGNVRELANVVERAVTLADGERIEVAVLPPAVRGAALPAASAAAAELPADGLDLQAHLDRIERSILEQALSRAGGVKTEAARHLSLTFRSLRYRLAKYRIGEP